MNKLFKDCRLRIGGITYVLPSEVRSLIEQGAVLVDMREEVETDIKSFAVDSLVCLPHDQFDEKWESLPLGKPLILADSVGIWSKTYAATLQSKGYPEVASLAGGFNEWLRDGYPVASGNCRPMNGPCLCMIRPHEKK